MVGWRHRFLSFKGRIGRKTFWLSLLILTGIQFVSFWVILLIYLGILETIYPGWSDSLRTMDIVAGELPAIVIWFLAGLWPSLAIFTKRWHDRNKSGWWNLITPPLLLPTVVVLGLALDVDKGNAGLGLKLLSLVYWGSLIWTMIELGFLRGTEGPNEYGPDPLAEQVSGESAKSGPVLGPIIPLKRPWIAYLFTSFEGRINRAKWWLGAVILLFISVGIMFTLAGLMGIRMLWEIDSAGIGPAEMTAVFRSFAIVQAIMLVIIAYPATALMKKRINDRDRPGWLVYVFWAPTVVGLVLSLAGLEYTFVDEGGVSMPATSGLYWIVSIAGGVVFIWALIELGFLRGTKGPNKYGPDPLAG